MCLSCVDWIVRFFVDKLGTACCVINLKLCPESLSFSSNSVSFDWLLDMLLR